MFVTYVGVVIAAGLAVFAAVRRGPRRGDDARAADVRAHRHAGGAHRRVAVPRSGPTGRAVDLPVDRVQLRGAARLGTRRRRSSSRPRRSWCRRCGLRHAPWRASFNAGQYALALAAASLVLPCRRWARPRGRPQDQRCRGDRHRGRGTRLVRRQRPARLDRGLAALRRQPGASRLRRACARRRSPPSACSPSGPLIIATGNFSAALVPLTLIPLFAVNELARYCQSRSRTRRCATT